MKKLRQQQHVKTMLCYLVVSGTLLLTRGKCVKYIFKNVQDKIGRCLPRGMFFLETTKLKEL